MHHFVDFKFEKMYEYVTVDITIQNEQGIFFNFCFLLKIHSHIDADLTPFLFHQSVLSRSRQVI